MRNALVDLGLGFALASRDEITGSRERNKCARVPHSEILRPASGTKLRNFLTYIRSDNTFCKNVS